MVKAISINGLKEKLQDVFCKKDRTDKKYAEVWLSDVDFGGLYQSDKFVLNVPEQCIQFLLATKK